MNRLNRILQAQKQTKFWIWWGRISPLLFLIGAFGLYEIFHTSVPFLFYTSWVIFITVSLIWWGWVMKIILDFIRLFDDLHKGVLDIKSDVDNAYRDIKEINKSRVDSNK
jgi:hypothetical protein